MTSHAHVASACLLPAGCCARQCSSDVDAARCEPDVRPAHSQDTSRNFAATAAALPGRPASLTMQTDRTSCDHLRRSSTSKAVLEIVDRTACPELKPCAVANRMSFASSVYGTMSCGAPLCIFPVRQIICISCRRCTRKPPLFSDQGDDVFGTATTQVPAQAAWSPVTRLVNSQLPCAKCC